MRPSEPKRLTVSTASKYSHVVDNIMNQRLFDFNRIAHVHLSRVYVWHLKNI